MSRLRAVTGNVGGARNVPIGHVLEKLRPHVVVLTEAHRARRHLRGLAKQRGYTLRQYRRHVGVEAPGIAVLVRDGVQIKRRWPMPMTRTWRSPIGRRRMHAPRTYARMRLERDGVTWRLLAVHFPPGGPGGGVTLRGANKPAWWESMRRAMKWLRRTDEPSLVLGDINATKDELLGIVGDGIRVVSRAHVDHAIVRNAEGHADRLTSPAGMHGFQIIVLTTEDATSA